MRYWLIIFATIIGIFAVIKTGQRQEESVLAIRSSQQIAAQSTSVPPLSNTQLDVTLEGILYQGPSLTIPGTNLPASSYIVSADGFDLNLDFSQAPHLASVASSNVNNKVKVRGTLQLKTTETPGGTRIDWLVLEVFEISPV